MALDAVEIGPREDDRYRLLVDAITDYAIYMLDVEGNVASWNPGAERFKGYGADEIIGQHFSRFYTEEDRATGLPARALATAAGEGRFEKEGWRVRKDGARFWAHVVIDPIRNPAGELIGFAKVTRDLTERRRAEESLKRSEEQFRLLVQGVTDYAIYMLDPTGHVSSWNAGAERIKGYAAAEIVGQHFSRFYTDGDRQTGEPEKALRTAASEGRFEKEGWRVRKDGSRFWAHVVIDPIRGDFGEVIGFAKITRDITERRDALQRLERARQLLFQAQKLDAIGQLTGGIAHDFNNLLMAVMGSLELLRKRLPPDPKASVLLENAMQGAQRGATLTQRMLAFARKQDLTLHGVDIPCLVAGMTGLIERSIGPSIQIRTRFAACLGPALTDANQLETALLNLAVNARDAMPDGGTITIEASDETVGEADELGLPAGAYVRLSVTDEGIGMDEQTLARATEPFYTTKGIGKGTGLGLPMVHGLAEQSGGRLVLKSRPGEGTRIELWLPHADSVGVERVLARALQASAPQRVLTVLAVDDDELVLTNTAAMLEDMGHRVLAATSTAEAMVLLSRITPDLVITDFAMPQVNGLQLAGDIRLHYPGMPVVLATGYAELPPGAGEDLLRLAKPYGQAELAQILQQACPPNPPHGEALSAVVATG
ncbi:PAS domain-containing sensor histidine kinase [Phenylobacterium sp.]|uniref:hybrid sensor histidine kinase/response regulator n=1 Tax=Phenylobacterium sp. TaxID=1871053 RepID=UPI0011F5D8A4|nr:PAS domain-containing sensor histidine kinase [Phenylobacterium sp.]THD51427.1 MAG: PAS domain-containing sensor histidine kinase [Phenylobacterium sp.]